MHKSEVGEAHFELLPGTTGPQSAPADLSEESTATPAKELGELISEINTTSVNYHSSLYHPFPPWD